MSCGWLWKSGVHKPVSEYILSNVAEWDLTFYYFSARVICFSVVLFLVFKAVASLPSFWMVSDETSKLTSLTWEQKVPPHLGEENFQSTYFLNGIINLKAFMVLN